MNNKEYISELAQRSGYTQAEVQKLVTSVIESMMLGFDAGEKVGTSG